MTRRVTFALLSVLGFAAIACVPPVPSNDLIVKYDPLLTTMGAIQERGTLKIGIPEGPPFGRSVAGADGGFVVAMATDLADSLGVDADFTEASDEELVRLIDSGALDVAYPSIPITEKAFVKHPFADPYWIGHERVLAFDAAIEGIDDLAGRTLCQAIDEVTGVPIAQLQPEVGTVIEVSDLKECSEVDAAIGSDLLLLGLAGEGGSLPTLVGPEINTAGYGAMVLQGETSFAAYISVQLSEAKTEGRWAEWYGDFISPILGSEPPDPPGMHAAEAAALYPLGFGTNGS
jgi:ABC-type amino acid transport substrate-binding protein